MFKIRFRFKVYLRCTETYLRYNYDRIEIYYVLQMFKMY